MNDEKNKQLIILWVLIISLSVSILYIYYVFVGFPQIRPPIKQNTSLETKYPNKLKLSSNAFKHSEPIPVKYTCSGENISPPLEISNIPQNTKSMVLIMDDPDSIIRTWTHWVVFNINPSTTVLDENALPKDAKLGTNDFGKGEYGGPCPPAGTHRYFFRLYALDTVLEVTPGVSRQDLEKAIDSHILDKAELVGTYKK